MRPELLPRRLEDLAGLRAARWLRESTGKQGDKYGPGAQRTMQDRAIERYGLADTGLAWTVLKSGWSGADSMYDPPATRTPDFRAMLASAEAGEFDVLVVGYTSRFLRDIQLTLHYRRFFHRNGVVVLICDDRILSSDPDDWERLVDKVKADEVYSRTLGRNIRTGIAEKRRSKGDPGGQPPLGFRRVETLLDIDPDIMPTVRRAFALAAAGHPDRAIAHALGLGIHTVRHVLKNPIYIGVLSDGGSFRLGQSIDIETWNKVQERREMRRTRVPGVAQRRCFALSLTCLDCGAPLHGHMGRYRHAAPVCAHFAASQPALRPVRGRHRSTAGSSYPSEWYESVIAYVLHGITIADPSLVDRVIKELSGTDTGRADEIALARIRRARTEALRRLDESRDVEAWKAAVSRLDAEEAAAKRATTTTSAISPDDVRRYISRVGDLWRDTDAEGRQALALSLFDSVRVSGFSKLEIQWSPHAKSYGLDVLGPDSLKINLEALGIDAAPDAALIVRTLKVTIDVGAASKAS